MTSFFFFCPLELLLYFLTKFEHPLVFLVVIHSIPLTSKYLSIDLTSHMYSSLVFFGVPLRNILNIDMSVFSQIRYPIVVIFFLNHSFSFSA